MNRIINLSKPIIELLFPIFLSYLLVTIAEERDVYDVDVFNPIVGLIFLVLVLEWIRRYQKRDNRPKYEQYIYLPATFIIFLIGLWVIKTLEY